MDRSKKKTGKRVPAGGARDKWGHLMNSAAFFFYLFSAVMIGAAFLVISSRIRFTRCFF